MFPEFLENFINNFSKLPGIGRKTSERLGFHLLAKSDIFCEDLSESIRKLKMNAVKCSICGNISDTDPCFICSNEYRDKSVICVVENIIDLYIIENTNFFNGYYHILGGVISPLNGITPDKLNIEPLINRIKNDGIKEIIFATSPTTEGDTTILYIKQMLGNMDVKITHLARGIPIGTDLQYAGSNSLLQAIKNREVVK